MRPGEGSVNIWLVMAVRRVRARLTGSRGVSFASSAREIGLSKGTRLAVRIFVSARLPFGERERERKSDAHLGRSC